MKQMQKAYRISEVAPYIDWLYFFHAWGLSGKPETVKQQLMDDARDMLAVMENRYRTLGIAAVCRANSDGDDIVIEGLHLPMLRQQRPSMGTGYCLCMADFVRPLSTHVADRMGVFATTVDAGMETDFKADAYQAMLAQTLADRLAEATAEKLHEEVRKTLWGYAPGENLSVSQLHHGEYQGIRPAIGYPSMPDVSLNFMLDRLLGFRHIGISLTENGMMQPHASVSGLMIAHPEARYFDLGEIGEDQLADYAHRCGCPTEQAERFLRKSFLK